MAEFTKGPWGIDAFTKNVVAIDVPDDGGDIICSEPDGDASASRWHENASLIAAAPDLYEALQTCILQIEYLHGKFKETGSGNAALAAARYAISKAQRG